ncbi:MAG: RusA family crossover junction endodeoxyribonuclease [Clostridiales bacterium]|nr:RusA family crossover junction endodeoxyribonuclease [Clostridiales bacterium]
MVELRFFCPMVPPTETHQEKKVKVVNGKPVFYEPQELKEARAKLMAHLAPHKPETRFNGCLRLMVKWCFPLIGIREDGEYRNTKPDLDNLQKLLQDVMTDLGFWVDDAKIVSLVVEKFWAKAPGIFIALHEVHRRGERRN